MKIIAKYGITIRLVNCLNMTCQNAARMTMLEKGTCLQWRPLVYSDLPIYHSMAMPGVQVKDPTQGVNV